MSCIEHWYKMKGGSCGPLEDKLPLPDMVSTLAPELWLQKGIMSFSVLLWLKLCLPEFKQRKEGG